MLDIVIRRVRIDDEKPLQDIGVENGRIVEIADKIEERGAEEIDAEGRAALPGFVEPHMHLEKAFLHRRLPARSGTLEEAIRVTGILKAKQEREDVLERSRRVLDMAVRNGTTVIRAHPDVDPATVERDGEVLVVPVAGADQARRILAVLGDGVRDFEFRHGRMDDVFLALTGRRDEAEEAA